MARRRHHERHFAGSDAVRDVILGMSDGLTTPFALAAGLAGAAPNNLLVVIGGLAEIAAGSISMGLGGYLAAQSEAETYRTELAREIHETEVMPHEERAEVRRIFRGYGLRGPALDQATHAITAERDAWIRFMMREEPGLEEPAPRAALWSAARIAAACALAGLIPLLGVGGAAAASRSRSAGPLRSSAAENVASMRRFHRATVQVPCLVLAVAFAVWTMGCRRWCPSSSPASLHHAPGSFGSRLLVVAPHPDDEILAAGTVIARTVQAGGEVHVVVATAGERGVNRTRARDLGQAREDETRRALARLAVPAASVEFLDYADETLATAWSDRWSAARHGAGAVPGTAVVEALRTAVRAMHPDTVIMPLALDEHPDHVAVARFTLLAVLAATVSPEPRLLGYVVHGERGWPACHVIGGAVPVVPPGCAGMLPWTGLLLAPSERERKEALIREYATQLGPALLHHARTEETFASDVTVPLGRAAAPWRPSLRRTARGIAITLPRAACGVDPGAGDRLRLRYFRGEALDERVVVLEPAPAVRGGVPGETLHAVADVGVVVKPGSVHVLLDGDSFAGVGGAVLEVTGAPTRGPTPAWLLRWS